MASIKYLEENGTVFYPVVHEQGVRDSDGVGITAKIAQTNGRITNVGNDVATLAAQVETLSNNEAVIAWDGQSVPVVANIPEGVEVEYNETFYEGTLEASSTTAGKTYYVTDGDGFWGRYITIKDDDSDEYVWFYLGTSDMNFNAYERKDDNVWLTEAQFNALVVKDPTKTYNVYEEVDGL